MMNMIDPNTEEMLGISYDSFIHFLIKKVQIEEYKDKNIRKRNRRNQAKTA